MLVQEHRFFGVLQLVGLVFSLRIECLSVVRLRLSLLPSLPLSLPPPGAAQVNFLWVAHMSLGIVCHWDKILGRTVSPVLSPARKWLRVA